jgi:hypothetical protein
VAWQEVTPGSANSTDVYVKRWNGTAWVNVGGRLDRTRNANAAYPSLVLRSDDQPVVAFEETGTSQDVYVRRWTGSAWQFLRNSTTSVAADVTASANAVTPHLAIRSDNVPVLALEQNGDTYIRRFLGNTWRTIEGGIVDREVTHPSAFPVVAVKSNKQPTVAWVEYSEAGTDIFVSSY